MINIKINSDNITIYELNKIKHMLNHIENKNFEIKLDNNIEVKYRKYLPQRVKDKIINYCKENNIKTEIIYRDDFKLYFKSFIIDKIRVYIEYSVFINGKEFIFKTF